VAALLAAEAGYIVVDMQFFAALPVGRSKDGRPRVRDMPVMLTFPRIEVVATDEPNGFPSAKSPSPPPRRPSDQTEDDLDGYETEEEDNDHSP